MYEVQNKDTMKSEILLYLPVERNVVMPQKVMNS